MAAKIIHFGLDDCYRIPVFRSAGYEVREAHSLEGLCFDLQRDEDVDAVVLSEDDVHQAQEVATVLRQRCAVPLILFRRTQNQIDESQFARVYSSLTPPAQWLLQTAELIAKSRVLQEESVRLRDEADVAIAKSQQERARSRSERAKYEKRKDPWKLDSGPHD